MVGKNRFLIQLSKLGDNRKIFKNGCLITNSPNCQYILLLSSAIPPRYLKQLKKVIHAGSLQEKIESLAYRLRDDLITSKELNRLSRHLIKHHTPNDPDLLKQFQINRSDLIMGVHCTLCSAIPMMKISGSWVCKKCWFTSKEGHLASLNDYALLLGPTITNKELRQFLKISSVSSASKLLSALNLSYTGTFKNRKYLLPSLN